MKRSVIAAIGLIGLGIIIGVILVSQFSPDSVSPIHAEDIGANKAPVQTDQAVKQLNNAYRKVSEAVTPTVVTISVEIETTVSSPFRDQFREFFRFFGEPEDEEEQKRRSEASGSGVIVSSDGYIVTNNHVVENAIEGGITVTTSDRQVYKEAKLVGSDPLTDLALLKIDADNLPTAHFAEMENVKVGDIVMAVGNPLGLNSTVTSGIISAIGRGSLNMWNRDRYAVEHYIQTDAAINPGNSGGGLYNLEGSLVGINTAIATRTGTYIGYGFAIPVDLVRAVINDLIDDGDIDRGYIGVSIRTVDEAVAKAVGLEEIKGVLVHDILEDSPADNAGVEPGDVILRLDGKEVATSNELQSEIVFRRAGDKVKLTIWRDGKTIEKTVTLKPKDGEEEMAEATKGESREEVEPDEPVSFKDLGFTVKPLTKKMKKDSDVSSGVLVTDVDRYSPASERGLIPGGIIVKVDREKVDSPKELKDIIESKGQGEAILMQVKYEDTYQIVAIEIPS